MNGEDSTYYGAIRPKLESPTTEGPVRRSLRDTLVEGADVGAQSTLKSLIDDTYDTLNSTHKLIEIITQKLSPVLDPRQNAKISAAQPPEPPRAITDLELEIEKLYTQARKLRESVDHLLGKVRI